MDYQHPDYNYQNPYTTSKASLDRQTFIPQSPGCPQPQAPTQPVFPQQPQFIQQPQGTFQQPAPAYPMPPYSSPYGPLSGVVEQSYIENILRLNKGKVGTFYFTYTDSNEWRDRVYKGVIEAAGRDHLIISDPKTGKRLLLQMIYFNYAEFDEEIAYEYPFG